MAKILKQEIIDDRLKIHVDLNESDILKGGTGSGNWGHGGRPGKVGGSVGRGSLSGSVHEFLLGDQPYKVNANFQPDFGSAIDLETGMEKVRKALGKDVLTIEDLAKAGGFPSGSDIKIDVVGINVELKGTNKLLGIKSMHREIRKVKEGIIIDNEDFSLDNKAKGKGLGTKIFSNQVINASKMGAVEIRTLAGGSPAKQDKMNGYYTWPRLGYDANLDKSIKNSLPSQLKKSEKVSDLMTTEQGRSWWKSNGEETYMKFDLTEGSQSRKALDAYVKEKFGTS